jgi:N utilization substance protein B
MAQWTLTNQQKAEAPSTERRPVGVEADRTPSAAQAARPLQREDAKREIEERKAARVLALQALYEIDMTNHRPDIVLYERITDAPPGEYGIDFLTWLVAGVLSNRGALDSIIAKYAPEWPVEQLAVIDRNALRLALYELGASKSNTPPKVVINEAVELAKSFGGDSSSRFVNGVLGAALDEIRRQGYN